MTLTLTRRRLIQSGAALGAAAALPGAALGRTTDTVRVGWGKGSITQIALQRGVFAQTLKDQGIKVEWVGPFPNHAPSMQAVVGGSADFGFWGSTTPALAAILAGSPLVFTQFLVYAPRSTAIIVKKDSGIDSVTDLVGKRVAVNRSGLGEFLVVAALEQNGIGRDQVEFVYLNPPDAAPAFGQGKVDAWSMWSPGVDIARARFDAKDIFFEGTDLDHLIDYSALVALRSFAERNGDLVRAVIEAYKAEGRWMTDNPLESEKLIQKEAGYDDSVRDHLAGLNRRTLFHEADDAAFLADFQRAADWLSDRKILPQAIRVADHVLRVPGV